MTEPPEDAWLSLDEAAARFGVSRLRVREAIAAGAVRAQRDNRGFWRVSLRGAAAPADAAALDDAQRVELLFDEIEEQSAALAEREGEVARLSALVARQQETMERALRLFEEARGAEPAAEPVQRLAALNERSHALIGETLDRLEARDAQLADMKGLMERALGALAGLAEEATRQRDVADRQRALLERLFAIAQTSLARLARGAPGGWFSRLRKRQGEPGAGPAKNR